MPSFKDIVTMRFVPERAQVGLSIVRFVTGATIFVRHGLEKSPDQWVTYWHRFQDHGVDPIGIGPHATLIVSIFSDLFCSVLVALGLATRWAALICFGTVVVAWAGSLHFALIGKTDNAKSGEHMMLYMAGLLCVIIAGPGVASLDRLLFGRRAENQD